MEHEFTSVIKNIIKKYFPEKHEDIFEKSYLIRYLNFKTKSASKGSKSRGSFANHYAIFVLVEDYINKGFLNNEAAYSDYDGAIYTELFTRMRKLPFGQKLQNHALNSRMNDEFKKYFNDVPHQPIIRDLKTKRYWINDKLLRIKVANKYVNIANCIIEIINAYVAAKKSAFDNFIEYSTKLSLLVGDDAKKAVEFINEQIQPNIDARIFEIVSYAILKFYYADTILYWGWSHDELNEENLKLYKTGRTNANDGGIDFVMKPLGRFFQVTETLDFKKYFLDIDKIQRYPISFVIKTEMPEKEILKHLENNAYEMYGIKAIVKRYMESIEEVINIPKLKFIFSDQVSNAKVKEIMEEIIIQSRLEFNYE
ncbi:Restriction endonuclease [Candidatus Magnetomoraceae bacterium gMMP-15]